MKALTIVEFCVFAVPYGLVPLISIPSIMFLIGTKSQWDRLPWSIAFFIATLLGLLGLTLVFIRRMREKPVGAGLRFLLLVGLAACVAPAAYHFAVTAPNATYPVEQGAVLWVLMLAWPAPVYLHWLVSPNRSDP